MCFLTTENYIHYPGWKDTTTHQSQVWCNLTTSQGSGLQDMRQICINLTYLRRWQTGIWLRVEHGSYGYHILSWTKCALKCTKWAHQSPLCKCYFQFHRLEGKNTLGLQWSEVIVSIYLLSLKQSIKLLINLWRGKDHPSSWSRRFSVHDEVVCASMKQAIMGGGDLTESTFHLMDQWTKSEQSGLICFQLLG